MNTSNITNYKPKDFAELLGVSVKTLQRWDREGTLKANRTPTDRRYYTYDQYLQFKGINIENDKRQVVIYARVSTRNQKDNLQNQVAFLRQFCNAKGIIIDQCIEDYGSGLNYNRKKWSDKDKFLICYPIIIRFYYFLNRLTISCIHTFITITCNRFFLYVESFFLSNHL